MKENRGDMTKTAMKDDYICSKCGSRDVIGGVPILDHGRPKMPVGYLSVGIDVNPDAIFFTEFKTFTILAWICITCSYTELYTSNTDELKKAFQKRVAKKRSKAKKETSE